MKKQAQFSRKGSALLIVLGMLAFMVVSAVSFSIYMRESRVPSSHLRRESTARYLLKSALANAVARLNGNFKTNYEIWGETDPSGKHYNYLDTDGYVEGLYDDQYPGLNDFTILGHNGDYWTKRVFTPFGQVAPTTTVSTLTLEGLAYLPPAIINEARVFSRTTRTAQWQNLAYDLGRYAFCAIDVSDCFDINKLASAKRRTSHPGERISFTSLYHDNPEKGSQLASLISGKISTTPFVSLADFNVAMGNTLFTPFARYINNGGNNGNIYLEDDVIVSNALFITDTWFPATNAYLTAELELKTPSANTSRNFDLSKKEDQPFAEGDFGCASILEVPTTGRMQQIMKANLGLVGYTCLYDYLDEDRVPLSLALPTVEAVPMVCGVQIVGSMPFTFREDTQGLPTGYASEFDWTCTHPTDKKEHTIKRTTKAVCFEGAEPENARVVGTVMYPFKRMGAEQRKGTFKVQALVAAFFGDAALKCRVENEKFRPTKNDWNGGIRDGIAFYKTTPASLSLPENVSNTSEAFVQFECDISEMSVCMPAYYIVTEKDVTPTAFAGESFAPLPTEYLDTEVRTVDGLNQTKNALTLFDAAGNALANWDTAKKGRLYTQAERAANPTGTRQADVKGVSLGENGMAPYLAVWVRVLDENNDTVDLSPATFCDDEIWLDGCDYGGNADSTLAEFCGPNVALLDFRGEQRFLFDDQSDPLTTFGQNSTQKFEGWDALFAPDPRYNFAPEDWFGQSGTSATKGNCQQVVESVLGVNNRDRDIFMFTSDQEHLQSIGELQFLPYVQDLGQNITGTASDFCRGARYNADGNFAARTTPSDLDKEGAGMFANSSRFWRTYSGCDDDTGRLNNPYYDLRNGGRVSVVNGTGGFRVNPLSPDMRVLSAALFDTPWDYYVASTNTRTNKIISEAESQPEDYAFGFYSTLPGDKWSEGAVTQIARAICEGTRSDAIDWMQKPARRMYPFDWGGYYEDLWADYADEDVEYLFGRKLGNNCKLHDVDRKFLFSFWRDCFQNRQQLFLIFLRAEPLAAGAGGVSNAQLGARGVALVWRDPAPPKSNQTRKARGEITDRQDWLDQLKNCPPHRTRVLFYHQFE